MSSESTSVPAPAVDPSTLAAPTPPQAYGFFRYWCIWGGPLSPLILGLLSAVGLLPPGLAFLKFAVLVLAVMTVQRWRKLAPNDRVAAVAQRTGMWHLGLLLVGEILGIAVLLVTGSMVAFGGIGLIILALLLAVAVVGQMKTIDARDD